MHAAHRQLSLYALVSLAFLFGCSTTVMLPPRVDLAGYGTIGMIELDSEANPPLPRFATSKLLEAIQSAQPGVRILELGSEQRALQAVEREELDFETIRALGERYRVDAILVGELDVTDVKPNVRLSSQLASLSARADVEATLSARLLETTSGATFWTSSARGRQPVAHVGITKRGPVRFGADDPENAYGRLVQSLVHTITADFRVRYEKR